jgi:hypothetical protein
MSDTSAIEWTDATWNPVTGCSKVSPGCANCYAERMAIRWLEGARYADTNGYQSDGPRDMWRWRDWVIEAYNRDLPFDQFTIEQIAGDMLPGATPAIRSLASTSPPFAGTISISLSPAA